MQTGFYRINPVCLKNSIMLKKTLITVLLSISLHYGYNQIITVKQDGSGDYTEIQAAIDNSLNGDTVLVWPGIYYENINFNGHSITLASLNLTTGNPSYVNKTVINGNGKSSCITIITEENACIQGFTITNGSGRKSKTAKGDNEITSGGGIFLGYALTYETLKLTNCIVKDNYASYDGGGIMVVNATLTLSGVTIKNNLSFSYAGGIGVVGDYPLIFDSVNLCSIYNNYSVNGSDITKAINVPLFNIYLDTISVSEPDYYNIFLINNPQVNLNDYLSFQHYNTESVHGNLYVSPYGDNNNTGLTEKSPLKNIAFAIAKIKPDSLNPDTIFITNGTYSKYGTNEKFPFGFKSYLSLIGQDKDSTILDANGFSSHFDAYYPLHTIYNIAVKNLTFKNGVNNTEFSNLIGSAVFTECYNSIIENVSFEDNNGYAGSALLINYCRNISLNGVDFRRNIGGCPLSVATGYKENEYPRKVDSVFITNNIFEHNMPNRDSLLGFGGALYIWGAGPYPDSLFVVISNTLFYHNIIDNGPYGGSIAGTLEYAISHFTNCTFVYDSCFDSPYSSCLHVGEHAKVYLNNIISYHNYPWEISIVPVNNPYTPTELHIRNSLIEEGYYGIECLPADSCNTYYDTSNIDTDPLFYGGPDFPFNLSDESPCIDAGTLDLPNFVLAHLPNTDLAGNPRVVNGKIDMGAYEWNPTVDIKELPKTDTDNKNKITVYPNPFGNKTTVSANWDKDSQVTIAVYNSAGMRVETLQHEYMPKGSSAIIWDTEKLPQGIYFVVMSIAGKEVESVKVVKTERSN